MFNIDLSFFKSSEFESEQHDLLEQDSNKNYQQRIVEELAAKDCKCASCTMEKHEEVKITDEQDNRKIFECECKGLLGHHFCVIPEGFIIEPGKGDFVIIQVDDVLEVSEVKEVGEYVNFKRIKMGLANETLPQLVRIANEKDLMQMSQNCCDEEASKSVFRKCAEKYELTMKLVDVHFQFDKKKLYFFYTSDFRVDFRELAKELASIFKTRIELRQIGVRDEAKKVGGLGTCGREYCCSTFLENFKKISPQMGCEQNSSSNLSKLSGPCGKLKCCMSYENEK